LAGRRRKTSIKTKPKLTPACEAAAIGNYGNDFCLETFIAFSLLGHRLSLNLHLYPYPLSAIHKD
jgi:hypothetical protein